MQEQILAKFDFDKIFPSIARAVANEYGIDPTKWTCQASLPSVFGEVGAKSKCVQNYSGAFGHFLERRSWSTLPCPFSQEAAKSCTAG